MGVLSKVFRFRHRRWPVLVGGMIAASVPLALVGVLPPGQAGQAVAALLRDPLAVLAMRSPGARPGGLLLQTKTERAGATERTRDGVPGERVLSAVRTRPETPLLLTPNFVPADVLPDVLPLGGGQAPALGAPTPSGFLVPAAVPAGTGGSGGPIGSGPGGGPTGGGTGTGGTPPPVTGPPPPVAAVPEPATWLTMLVGFGLVGGTLRRRPHRRRAWNELSRAA